MRFLLMVADGSGVEMGGTALIRPGAGCGECWASAGEDFSGGE